MLNRRHSEVPGGEPIHMTIYRDLLRKIEEGELKPGDRIPSEAELQEIYQVSRTPVRQALGKLQMEGLIDRRRGRGSHVQSPVEVGAWGLLSGFGQHYRDYWERLDSMTLRVAQIEAPADVAESLGIGPNADVVFLRRLRLFDEKPVVLLNHYLPSGRFTREAFAEAGDFFSVRAVLRQLFGISIRSATEDLRAVRASGETAELLGVDANEPLLHVYRVSYDYRNPVQVISYYVRTDLWHYRANLGLST